MKVFFIWAYKPYQDEHFEDSYVPAIFATAEAAHQFLVDKCKEEGGELWPHGVLYEDPWGWHFRVEMREVQDGSRGVFI